MAGGGDPLAGSEELIRRVYAYVAYRIGAGAEAEDVTSDVFERAVRYRATYDRRKGAPLTWLLGIARTCIADSAARRSHATSELADVPADGDVEREAVERMTVRAAVAALPSRDRDLIALRYGAGLKAREIAELYDERPNAIEVALHRALGRLRSTLDPEEPDAVPLPTGTLPES
jgi:RNA polymerase sigma factor (sigma-70 family)